MADEELVEQVLETYELPSRVKERIKGIAVRRINELQIHSFDSVYRLIGDLVEAFSVPFAERYVLRLDSRVPGTTSTFYEIIGSEDKDLLSLFEDQEPDGLSLDQAISMLETHVDEKYAHLVRQLFSRSNDIGSIVDISPKEMTDSLHQIEGRLSALYFKYEINGRLVIPRRPIVAVKLRPLTIRFDRGPLDNPLQHFRENEDIYNELTRWQLQRLDKPLYLALKRNGQLGEAIPDVHNFPHLTDEDTKNLLQTLRKNEGSIKKTAEITGHAPLTIRRHAKRAGIKTKPKGGHNHLSQDEVNTITDAYTTYNASSYETAKHLTHSPQTITRYWRMAGLNIGPQYRPQMVSIDQDGVQEITKAYDTYDGKIKRAARHLHHSKYTIRKYWKSAGLIK